MYKEINDRRGKERGKHNILNYFIDKFEFFWSKLKKMPSRVLDNQASLVHKHQYSMAHQYQYKRSEHSRTHQCQCTRTHGTQRHASNNTHGLRALKDALVLVQIYSKYLKTYKYCLLRWPLHQEKDYSVLDHRKFVAA